MYHIYWDFWSVFGAKSATVEKISFLEDYLKLRGGALPLLEALGIGIQLCTVLDYLHTHKPQIVFRDLKPSNVMRAKDGHLYLIDFAVAWSPDSQRLAASLDGKTVQVWQAEQCVEEECSPISRGWRDPYYPAYG